MEQMGQKVLFLAFYPKSSYLFVGNVTWFVSSSWTFFFFFDFSGADELACVSKVVIF